MYMRRQRVLFNPEILHIIFLLPYMLVIFKEKSILLWGKLVQHRSVKLTITDTREC